MPWLAAFTLLLIIAGTLGSLNRAGFSGAELENAELSRRIAHGLFGAGGLGAPSDDGVPTRGELGRGELPFLAMALGFRLFGLAPWAARLPLALSALAGVAALFFMVGRLGTRRVAWLAVLSLGTMPLFFLQARVLLGDVMTMSANALAQAGLCVALFDGRARQVRWASLLLAVGGLAAGYLCRGLLLGVSVPTLGVGTAFIALTFAGYRSDPFATRCAAAVLLSGILAAGLGALAVQTTPANVYSMLIGSTEAPGVAHSFDASVAALGYALFPWAALLPGAAGRALSEPKAARGASPGPERERALRLAALCTLMVALVMHTALAPAFGLLPFVAPSAAAVLIALTLEDWNRGAQGSRWFAMFAGGALTLLVLDVRSFPEKALVPLAPLGTAFPDGFARPGFGWFLSAGAFVAGAFFFTVEAPPGFARLPRFRQAQYAAWFKALSALWSGQLWFAVLTLGSALLGFELILLLSDRHLHWAALDNIGETTRLGVRAGWVLVAAFCMGPPLVLLLRDVVRSVLDPGATLRCAVDGPLPELRPLPRGTVAAVVFALGGAVLSFVYYPALMQRLSPQGAFEAFRNRARPGEPLGLLELDAAATRYAAGVAPVELADADAALDWLLSPGRRFLGFSAKDLATLNAGYRARSTPRRNLPVLDASTSAMLLAVNELPETASDHNPLARSVLGAAPSVQHPLSADLAGKLQLLGWDLGQKGDPVETLLPGVDYDFTIYFRVNEPLAGDWEVFIHVDGLQQRYNGDHPLLAGTYPPSLWLPGDFIADHYVIRLPPNFRAGSYRLFFGLFSGDRRLEVRHGLHQDDRIVAGILNVR